jgi:hypothetical protein
VFHLPSRTRTAAAALAWLAIGSGTALAATVPPAQDVRQFACPPAQVQDAGFADIAGSPFALEINCLAAYGITTGATPSSYAPGREVLRAQMAQFIARLATEHAGLELDTRDSGFTDIAGLSPSAQDAINGLANAGVVNGTSPTTYGPAGQVKRDQMASFLARLQEQVGEAFPAGADFFGDDDGNTHEDNINRIAAAGIVNGTGDGGYSPGDPVTRQQMSAFLMRYVADRVQTGEIRSIYSAADTTRASLTGETVITATASGKVPVRLDRPATFTVPHLSGGPGSVQVTGEGRYAGFALVADGTDRDRVVIGGGRVDNGLPADSSRGDSETLALSLTDALDFTAPSYELPAGDYHLYVIADGSPVTVKLSLGGLSGSTRLTPTVPVAADLAQPDARYLPQGVQTAGAPGRLRGEGLLFNVAASLHSPSLQQDYTTCTYVGEERTANATYAPGCPDANVKISTILGNADPTARTLALHVGGAYYGVAETFGQGYSLTNVGINEHVDYRALWLTF